MNAIRFQGKRRLRAKLIGQRPLNQLSSLPGARIQGRHLHTAFLPIEMKPGLATFSRGLLPPADGEMPIRLLKCTVLDRIGYELVQDHRKCLDCGEAQRNVFRSVERDRSTLSHRNGLRGQLGFYQFVEGDPAAVFVTKEEPLHAAENVKAVVIAGLEIV